MIEATFEQAYPIALRAARAHATAAVVKGSILLADKEDFEQEGVTACWRALPQFDPARASLPTFVERVVTARLASMVRAAHKAAAAISLDCARCQIDPGIDPLTFHSDVWRLLSLLGEDDRGFLLLLMEQTPTEVSLVLGMARSTVYARIRKLRRRFIAAGFVPNGGRR